MATLTEEDEGKILVDSSGKDIGLITAVEGEIALVDPDPGFVEGLLSMFGRTEGDSDDIRVPHDAVETVTDEEVRLRETL